MEATPTNPSPSNKYDHDKVYVVLGMHRSGTSFLSKALEDQGVYMDGTQGVYESYDFYRVNQEMLNRAGGSWNRIPKKDSIDRIGTQFKDKILGVINKHKRKFWGWKDPRTSLTVDSYLPHLEGDVYLVCIFRKPDKVGASLQKRGDMPAHTGAQLAKEYNRSIIESVKKFCEIDD